MKRYLRIDLEYEVKEGSIGFTSTAENVRRIMAEDMPYVRVLRTRNAISLEDLETREKPNK